MFNVPTFLIFVLQILDFAQLKGRRISTSHYMYDAIFNYFIETGTVTYPDFLNTKITSVFKSINADTLEEMTQIRTDEYGVQSIKMKKLKDEIERSRKTNSDLMIDNFIMKTRLDNEREPNTKQTIGSIDQKLRNYMSKRSTFRCNDEKSRNLKEELIEISSDLTPHDSKSAFNLENKNDNIKNNWKHIEGKPETDDDVELLVKKSTTLTNGSTDDGVPSNGKGNTHIKPKTINIFCWRCMRRGHVGNACNESTTLLGRMICGKCNLVGHETESCKYY